MKAKWNDAPDYIRRRPRKGAVAWLIPGLIGTAIMLAALQMVSSAFLKGTAQGIADKRIHPKPAPIAEITRAEPAATKDWDRVVEEVAARGATPQPQTAEPQAGTTRVPPNKQTVYTDANYVPRGADNVLSLREASDPIELAKPATSKEITIVGERPSMKDRACWPYKEGSIERRNCRNSVGLNYRD
ncbi:hypothetical protein [Pseudomonas lopnurensis]|uniref:hypothetical protein n=1 Tax=Pseudomonas lopnurensis TaxID=1477517 RepID=UPI0028AB0DA1|nr:hypothetical protein [Pseudomonas lopnurensis]